MRNLQKMGGTAALIGAGTNILGAVVYATLLVPKGFGSANPDPSHVVALLAGNQTTMRLWLFVIWLAFGVSLIPLALALDDRLRARSPELAQVVNIFTLMWAVLVLVVGALAINNLDTVVSLHAEHPARAMTVWLTLDSVETGLGAGGGETIVTGLWMLLVSWAALQAKALPRLQNYLGVVVGLAGVLYVFTASTSLLAVNATGLIIWFVWLGIVMLRTGRVSAEPDPSILTSSQRVGGLGG